MSNWLKDERLRLKLTHYEAASILGVTRPTYSKYEANPDDLSIGQLRKLQASGIDISQIPNADLKSVACPACDGTGILYKRGAA